MRGGDGDESTSGENLMRKREGLNFAGTHRMTVSPGLPACVC